MKTWHYNAGELYCEEARLSDLAAQFGTPTYIYSARQMLANVQRLQDAFAALNPRIHYSMKANANLSLIQRLHGAGLGMDAVSGGEIYKALTAGVPAQAIVFAGVGKTAHELRFALEKGVGWFNVESLGELDLLNALGGEMDKTAQVALRLNPEVQADTHHHIATGHSGAKFGLNTETIADILARQNDFKHLRFAGIHVHIGSQLETIEPTRQAVSRALALVAPYPHIRTVNIGGGFPIAYTDQASYPPIRAFADALQPLLAGYDVKLEPGRFIVANAGGLLITTLYHKKQGEHDFLITDGSMAELLRPALYGAVHPIMPLKEGGETRQPYIVAGPVCESADILNASALLPATSIGEHLLVTMAGAYGFAMASNYNQRPRPAEVLVEGENCHLIRRRETWEDLIQAELVFKP